MGVHQRGPITFYRSQYRYASSLEGDDPNEQSPRYHGSSSKDRGRGIHSILMSQWWKLRSDPNRLSISLTLLTFVVGVVWHLESTITLHQPRVLQVEEYMLKDDGPWLTRKKTRKPRMVEPMSLYWQEDSEDERMYEAHRVLSTEETVGCPFIADWQRRTGGYPTCNQIHELGFHMAGEVGYQSDGLQYLASGGYNDVWFVIPEGSEDPEDFVLKTSVFSRHYTPHDINDHQRDALIMEQTTASPYVLNMYAYCGKASLVERATGTMQHWVKANKSSATPIQLLRAAYSLAQGVADMHLFHNGTATFAHADVKVSQFLIAENGVDFKINDFNRGRLLTSKNPPEICPFKMGNHHKGNTNRSPEEYTDNGPQTDKIDVYALGSLFYYLLVGTKPFATVDYKKAMQLIRDGVHPELDEKHLKSTDASIQAIVEAMEWTWKYDRHERPQSREVARLLKKRLIKIQAKSEQGSVSR